jgi:transposase
MFADEARFGRINCPRPCWAPTGLRPKVASQLIREFTYLYGAVSPKDGACCYLIMPTADTECFQIFLDALAKKFARHYILLFVDGAGNHSSRNLVIPANIKLAFLPAYSPELNPQENLWDEIREKIFKNYALKSMDEVYAKLEDAALYIERNPALVKSITSAALAKHVSNAFSAESVMFSRWRPPIGFGLSALIPPPS